MATESEGPPPSPALVGEYRAVARGSDILVPAVLLDLYPKSLGGNYEVLME